MKTEKIEQAASNINILRVFGLICFTIFVGIGSLILKEVIHTNKSLNEIAVNIAVMQYSIKDNSEELEELKDNQKLISEILLDTSDSIIILETKVGIQAKKKSFHIMKYKSSYVFRKSIGVINKITMNNTIKN